MKRTSKPILRTGCAFIIAVCIVIALAAPARASELDELKTQIQAMQQSMEQMQKKIDRLERENQQQKQQTAAAKPAQTGGKEGPGRVATTTTTVDQYGNQTVTIAPTAVTIESHASQVTPRGALNDNQEAAPRPNDLTLDPKYRGFVPIPNTPVLIKFNAKPRVDFTDDPQNTGNPDRFVTAQIPVEGDFFKGGGNQFNVNAKGSQL